MKIDMVPIDSVRPASWRATHVLKPDMELIRVSLYETGWIQPIQVRLADMTIIDGYHRWVAASATPKVRQKLGDSIPVIFHDIDEVDAMILHVRLNRARGNVVAYPLGKLLKNIIVSGKYDSADLETILLMSADEVDLMLSSGLLKRKTYAEHAYSRAWVPIEAPSATEAVATIIERPPNADR